MAYVVYVRIKRKSDCDENMGKGKEKMGGKDKKGVKEAEEETELNKGGETESMVYKLHQAAYRGDVDKVRALLRANENVNSLNMQGDTPLLSALIGKGKKEVKVGSSCVNLFLPTQLWIGLNQNKNPHA